MLTLARFGTFEEHKIRPRIGKAWHHMCMSPTFQDRRKQETQLPEGSADGGVAAKFKLSISKITMSDDTELMVLTGGVTVIVGGNNSGKSTFLKDVQLKLDRSGTSVYRPILVKDVELAKEGSESDLFVWLLENASWHGRSSTPGFRGENGTIVPASEVSRFHRQGDKPGNLGKMSRFFVRQDGLHKRIEVVKPVDQRETLDGWPSHPLHWV
jgi:hypothetical protein